MAGVQTDTRRRGIRRTVAKTLVALAAMCVFAFALVPLYDVFCEVTGLNGKTANQAQALAHEDADEDRVVTMQFITRGSSGLAWSLEAHTRQVRVHPGQSVEVNFTFENRGDEASVARAVPSVTPSEGALHLRKLACFCFENQRLAPGESFKAPLVFQLTRDLPDDIKTVTLVYTLYRQDVALSRASGKQVRGGET